ncbi:MAG: hypothetical protein M1816_007303 [Peltula sp. TS41687]|nr:MAG: hypothetical protein M1816_007303 [Peltula sp. TS41687]
MPDSLCGQVIKAVAVKYSSTIWIAKRRYTLDDSLSSDAARRISPHQPLVRRLHKHQWLCIRDLHNNGDDPPPPSPTDPAPSPAKQPSTSAPDSLLDELFPGASKPAEEPRARPTRRHIPRLELPVDLVPGDGQRLDRWWKRYKAARTRVERKPMGPKPIGLIERYVEASREPKARLVEEEGRSHGSIRYPWRMPQEEKKPARLANGQEVALLALYNASTSLTESDFRRIVPRGKHIREWRGEGEILEIIPGRDPETLTPLGFYFLLFASYSSAITYRNEALRLHRLAQKHTPRSLQSPIPPPPGYIVDGEDVYAALQSYTLLPPSQKLVLHVLDPPFTPAVQEILDQGGYARLVNRNARSKNAVCFRVDGLQLPLHVVQKTIERDGRLNRPLPWRLIQHGGAISVLEDDATMSFGGLEEEAVVVVGEEEEEGEEEEGAGGEVGKGSSADHHGREKNGTKIWPGQTRCIVMFEDSNEATRFVRAWNKRPFPLSKKSPFYGRIKPLVDVELLW